MNMVKMMVNNEWTDIFCEDEDEYEKNRKGRKKNMKGKIGAIALAVVLVIGFI